MSLVAVVSESWSPTTSNSAPTAPSSLCQQARTASVEGSHEHSATRRPLLLASRPEQPPTRSKGLGHLDWRNSLHSLPARR